MHFDEYTGRLFEGSPVTSRAVPESEQEPADEKEFGVRVEIDEEVYKKIMHWIDKAPGEVSGLGKVVHDTETNVLRVVDAMLLPQKNTGASTEIDGQAIAKAMYVTKDAPGDLRWWWHSHVNMDVFWSGTDVATIKMLGSGGWFLNTVFNKKREMKSAYCQVAPIRMIVDDLDTEVVELVDEEKAKKWDEEYEKNCKTETLAETIKSSFPYGWRREEDDDGTVAYYKDKSKKDDDDGAPELADIYPREKKEMSDDDLLTYFTLEELYDLKEKGEVTEELWDRAIQEATDSEVDAFFNEKGFDVGGG